jgi:type IV secretion system protein VirB10
VVQGVILFGALLVSAALAWAFVVQPALTEGRRDQAVAERKDEARGAVRPSERVTDQPASYDRLKRAGEGGSDPGAPTSQPDLPTHTASSVDPSTPSARQSGAYAAYGPRPVDQAASSSLFFAGSSALARPAADDPTALPPTGPTHTVSRDYGAVYSPHGLINPISPYELKAGAIIPGVLLTAIDTSRPGPVVATVSQNVFDSVTGRHLVAPQGTRLIGRHEGESAFGDRRAFLVWDRMILPNGKSVLLSEAPGVDAQGAVGVKGEADRRLLPLSVAVLAAGAVTTLGELARGGSEERSLVATAGDAAAIEASRVGGRLVDRELNIQPSIRVSAGAPVRVMITRDLILEPYRR